MKLDGSELLVLQACRDLHKDQYGNVHDDEIAQAAFLSPEDVRAVLESLEGYGLVTRVRLITGQYAAQITSKGLPELSQRIPPPDESKKNRIKEAIPIKVVPKGLRSFDKNDADYFLELLPDYPGQGKLPESIEYWKSRIEETQVDLTFRVGVIYGPSGCGKTSLVKAGLLPKLSNNILTVAIEATPDDTEARLLTGVQTRCPDLPKNLGLVDSLAALHWDGAFPPGKKLLLVLDQFEQWLLAKRGQENTELVNALRHCDGNRVQAVIMVRDEYYGPTDPLQRELGIEFRRNLNSFRVEPFSQPHARKVLAAFGRGSERLREGPTPEQEEFIEQAVAGLAVDNNVMPVRLALFTQLFRGREWSPWALREIGGTERVGFIFLEETLVSRYADPRHKRHLSAIQSVLKVLLPESGTDIKGNMKSHRTLLEASGYGARPNEFDALLGILDGELRLITPTEPEGRTPEDRQDQQLPGERYYQLTHDYLVPSLREWLNKEQMKTWRGRAELRLAERSALWNAKPENRHLPALWEWGGVWLLTRKQDWTEPQRRMMRKAGRVHAVRGLVALLLLVGAALTGLMIQHQISVDKQATTAVGLVQRLLDADTTQVPEIVRSMSAYRRWIDPELKKTIGEAANTSSRKLHASLALLPVDPSQVDFLFSRLLAASPTELPVPVIRDALKPHQASLIPKLWSTLDSAKPGDVSLLRAASALADYDGTSLRWEAVGGKVAEALVTVNPVYLGPWIDALLPVRMKLTTPLVTIFHDKKRPDIERTLATSILKSYASDDPDLLADLLLDSEEKPFAVLFDKLKARQERAVPVLEAELARKPAPDATADAQDQLAQRQARAAVALVRLGQGEKVWNLLRHSPDPSVRSYIVNWLKPLGAGPEALMTKLEGLAHDPVSIPKDGKSRMDAILFHPETSERRALILALGRYNLDELSTDKREPLVEQLREMYRNDPDAGIHGAAEWTLRRWKHDEKLAAIDVELKKLKDRGNRRWYVNSEGQTLAVIEGPIEFSMGSPVSRSEPDRYSGDTPHRQPINRRFVIATKEVTVEQYRRFLKENPKIARLEIDRFSPEPTGPMNGLTWYEAAAYCNWLSQQEGLATCYKPNDEGEFAEGMKIVPDALKQPGYRLPTEAEWEYACRADAVTSRYYGRSVELLGKYAWYLQNSQDRAWPCGQLLPNELGLFDMLGNAYEWCHEQYYRYPEGEGNTTTDDINILLSIKEQNPRLLRGGSFFNHPAIVRSANRGWSTPSNRGTVYGFRPSRTYH